MGSTTMEHSAQNTGSSIDKTIDRVDGAIRSTVDTVKDQANKYIDEAKSMAACGKEVAEKKVKEVEEAVKQQSDSLANYIKDQPLKSALIAFAAGYAFNCLTKK